MRYKKFGIALLFCAALLVTSYWLPVTEVFAQEGTRMPAVAGRFYSDDRAKLENAVNSYLIEADKKYFRGELVALIVPHGGYIYSGQVAGAAYKQIENKDYDDIIILGPSHYEEFKGASVGAYGTLATPLGNLQTDRALIGALLKEKNFGFNKKADEIEHSVETQLPFLKEVSPDSKVVPILIGSDSPKNSEEVAQTLVRHLKGKKVLLIASVDLSHYHPYADALVFDKEAIRTILSLSPTTLHHNIGNGICEMCGGGAVMTAMIASRLLGADKAVLLKYANSGDTSGTKDSVVGYAAIAIYRSVNR